MDITQNKVRYVHYTTKWSLITPDSKNSILSHSILHLSGSISASEYSTNAVREIFPESFPLISGMACIGVTCYELGITVILTMLTQATISTHEKYRCTCQALCVPTLT